MNPFIPNFSGVATPRAATPLAHLPRGDARVETPVRYQFNDLHTLGEWRRSPIVGRLPDVVQLFCCSGGCAARFWSVCAHLSVVMFPLCVILCSCFFPLLTGPFFSCGSLTMPERHQTPPHVEKRRPKGQSGTTTSCEVRPTASSPASMCHRVAECLEPATPPSEAATLDSEQHPPGCHKRHAYDNSRKFSVRSETGR